MDPSRFVSSEFGELRSEPDSSWVWFDPAPLPRRTAIEDQTQLALSRADHALGHLAGVSRMLPTPELLTNPYAIKEALASARIEGTQADLQDVFEAEARPSAQGRYPDVEVVSRYLRALNRGRQLVEQGRSLDFEVITAVHRCLLGDDERLAGLPRGDHPVWLGSPTDRRETAEFVPPVGEALARSIADWNEYVANPPAVAPLLRAALLHYQFLTIHPFFDGNGRVGRLLVLLFLAAENQLSIPLLYLSPFFESRRREYYDRLQAVRERGEIQSWLQFFLTAVEAQATDGISRAARLLELRERYRNELAGSRNRSPEVVELLFKNPVVTAETVREALEISHQGALNLIRSLEARGWLDSLDNVGRGRGGARLWLAVDVFDAIQADQMLVQGE